MQVENITIKEDKKKKKKSTIKWLAPGKIDSSWPDDSQIYHLCKRWTRS